MKDAYRFAAHLLPLAGALLLAGCRHDADLQPGSVPARPLTATERQTAGSVNDFAYREFRALRLAGPPANLCFSPLSAAAALTMAYNGADGSTRTAMQQTLGFNSVADQETNEAFQSMFALFRGLDSRVTFTAANSLWYNQNYQLSAPFVQTNQTYFGATVQGLDFAAPAAKTTMNNWVNTQTQGRIPAIVDETDKNDVLYLLNAVYFKGAWTYRFDQALTRPEPFHQEDGSAKNADFMTLFKGRYQLYQDAQQQVVDLPYGDRHFSMTFVVPQGAATLADVADRLSASQLSTWLAKADTTSAELHLPKFRFDYDTELKTSLSQLGMGLAFTDKADFSRMVSNSNNLSISKVKHKTFLEVNEEGTEAAAATSVQIGVNSIGPNSAIVRLDRPFFFLIRERSSGTILFMGQLVNP
ncbi:MAG: serpin family protein [Hymenobacter sp.]